MTSTPTLTTQRLILRSWRPEDLQPFAHMNTDPEVLEFLPGPLTLAESEAFITRITDHFDTHGFGLWAVEVPGISDFIGYVGLLLPKFEAHFTPCVEIGWRLARPHWGFGYATEAASRALAFGFETMNLPEIVSFTVPENRRSRAVMTRLGMAHSAQDDFRHPNLPSEHPLSVHVLYRLNKAEWEKTTRLRTGG